MAIVGKTRESMGEIEKDGLKPLNDLLQNFVIWSQKCENFLLPAVWDWFWIFGVRRVGQGISASEQWAPEMCGINPAGTALGATHAILRAAPAGKISLI